MADIVDALTWKLQSKICYHRDGMLEYMEIQAMVDNLVEENKKFRDEKMEYLGRINTVIREKENLERAYQAIKEQVAPMEEQLETVKEELAVAKEQLAAAKYEHVGANHENVVSMEELLMAKEQLARKNEELEVLRKKLQESEAMQTQLHPQKRKTPRPEPVHFKRVTRSTYKREMLPQGPLANDAHTNRLKKDCLKKGVNTATPNAPSAQPEASQPPEAARKISKRARKPNPGVSGDCWVGGGYIGL